MEETELTRLENQVENGRGGAWEYLCLVRKLKVRRSDKVLNHGLSILNDHKKRSGLGSESKLYTRVEVIVEKAERSDIPNIDKKKYLVPADLTVEPYVYVIRKRIKLSAEKAIFIFVDNVLPLAEKKDEDGFLYVTYSGENTFGESS